MVTSVVNEQLNYLDTPWSRLRPSSGMRDETQKQKMNNQIFDNALLTRLSVRVNSRQYLDRKIETNFAERSENYSRTYTLLQEAVKKYSDTDSGSQMSVKDFAALYPIIHVDVSKHRERVKMGTTDLEYDSSWQKISTN